MIKKNKKKTVNIAIFATTIKSTNYIVVLYNFDKESHAAYTTAKNRNLTCQYRVLELGDSISRNLLLRNVITARVADSSKQFRDEMFLDIYMRAVVLTQF